MEDNNPSTFSETGSYFPEDANLQCDLDMVLKSGKYMIIHHEKHLLWSSIYCKEKKKYTVWRLWLKKDVGLSAPYDSFQDVKIYDSVRFNWRLLQKHNGNPLQYSCLENLMDGAAWWAIVHRVAKSRTQLSNLTFKWNEEQTPTLSKGQFV